MKLLYNTYDSQALADLLVSREENEFTAGMLIRDTFPDGEKYMRNASHIKGSHCVILGSTHSEQNLFEIMNLAYQITTNGAKKLSILIPFYGYQTMERSSNPGEVVMAKNIAHWLSSIPRAAHGNEIIMLELHTDAIMHYFDSGVTTRHIASTDIVMKACTELAGTEFVLGSTDVGRAKAIEYIYRAFMKKQRQYKIETAFVYARRDLENREEGNKEITGVNADVKGKTVVIYDDMIRTGGSLIKAARVYRDAGAKEVYAVSTHGVLPGKSLEKIYSSKMIKKLALTNSHPNAAAVAKEFPNFVSIYSVAELLSRYV